MSTIVEKHPPQLRLLQVFRQDKVRSSSRAGTLLQAQAVPGHRRTLCWGHAHTGVPALHVRPALPLQVLTLEHERLVEEPSPEPWSSLESQAGQHNPPQTAFVLCLELLIDNLHL